MSMVVNLTSQCQPYWRSVGVCRSTRGLLPCCSSGHEVGQ